MKLRGFTIVELLIVIIIIAILGVIALPQFLNAQDRGKQASTIANLRNVANALSLYHVDNNEYPVTTSVSDLADSIEPVYMERMPLTDAWGNDLIIVATEETYRLGSCGKPTSDSPCSGVLVLEGSTGGETNTFQADIVVEDGAFIQYPIGLQQ